MADTQKQDATAEAVHELGTGAPAATIDAAFGPNWDAWTKHVLAHVQLPDADKDGEVEPAEPVVPLLAYGKGPNDYISTDIDAGQVVVRDGNDPTGKAWKFALPAFYRFLAHAQGKSVEGDEDEAKGPGPYEAAIRQNERTAKLVEADRDATAEAQRTGETRTASSNRSVAQPAGQTPKNSK